MNTSKRKEGPQQAMGGEGRVPKKQKGGSGGKWQTPHQKAKLVSVREHGTIDPGDAGIWATCARGQEGKATAELRSMLLQFAEQFYDIAEEEEKSDDDADIEASIKKETAAMTGGKAKPSLFSFIRLDVECVLFVKVQPRIDPVDFVHRICEAIVSKPGTAPTRYINRLTPMTLIGKATEKGLENIVKTVVSKYFELAEVGEAEGAKIQNAPDTQSEGKRDAYSYAIRPTIRNHSNLKRDAIVKNTASSIAGIHKVNLTKPDKVILVEIYQTICGVSVVEGDWEALKRYNVGELSRSAARSDNK